jgi:hypothetical protein
LDNEFTDGRSYGCGSGGGLEEFESEVREAMFAEDKACILFTNVESKDIWETGVIR